MLCKNAAIITVHDTDMLYIYIYMYIGLYTMLFGAQSSLKTYVLIPYALLTTLFNAYLSGSLYIQGFLDS